MRSSLPSIDAIREERFTLHYYRQVSYSDWEKMAHWQRLWHLARLIKQKRDEKEAQDRAMKQQNGPSGSPPSPLPGGYAGHTNKS